MTDKGPKTNPEAELGVLGVLILDGDPKSIKIQTTLTQCHEGLFYTPVHRELFNLIKKRFDLGENFHLHLLLGMEIPQAVYDLISSMILGNYYSMNLMDAFMDELIKLHQIRQQLYILESTVYRAYREIEPEMIHNLIHEGVQELSRIDMNKKQQGCTVRDVYEEYISGEFIGSHPVDCGIKQFGVVKNSGLITIAGNSGVGKTYFGIYFMHEIMKNYPKKHFLFFSLEMPRNDIWERYLTIYYNKAIEDITDDERESFWVLGRILDEPRMDIDYIERIVLLESMRCPIGVIVIDYIGLIASSLKYEREDLRISNITQRLAALAMRHNCIVLGLTQVNRDPAKRTKEDRTPYPSDVADSVGSVRSSSLWLGIDRPELHDDSGQLKNKFVVKCRKSRYGTNFEAWFNFNNGRFAETRAPYNALDASKPKKTHSDLELLNSFIGEV